MTTVWTRRRCSSAMSASLPDDLAEPAATADSYARWRSYDRVTWPDYLRSRGASPEAITLMTVGGDATDLSALYVLRQFAMLRRSTQRYKIQGGMDLLPRAMASALGTIVRYNAPVVRVTRESSAPDRAPGELAACVSASTIGRTLASRA